MSLTVISDRDRMFDGDEAVYLQTGRDGLGCIMRGLEAAGRERAAPQSILDFACGHGRVLRHLRAAFPDAEITATDIDQDGVEFCAQTFGVRGVVSHDDPRLIDFDRQFELIWAGSLFTHMDVPRWRAFLALFESVLLPRGVLVFTTHGRYTAEELRYHEGHNTTLFEPYDRTGFGYTERPGRPHFGCSLSTLEWVRDLVETETCLSVVLTEEHGWASRQDVVTCVRPPEASA